MKMERKWAALGWRTGGGVAGGGELSEPGDFEKEAVKWEHEHENVKLPGGIMRQRQKNKNKINRKKKKMQKQRQNRQTHSES